MRFSSRRRRRPRRRLDSLVALCVCIRVVSVYALVSVDVCFFVAFAFFGRYLVENGCACFFVAA